MTLREK